MYWCTWRSSGGHNRYLLKRLHHGWKFLTISTCSTSPYVLVNSIIYIGSSQNLYSSYSIRRLLPWRADQWIFPALDYMKYNGSLIFGSTYNKSGLQIRVHTGKLFFLFLNQNICCGYSKELTQWDSSFKHTKHMFKLMGKEINAILGAQTILIWTFDKGTGFEQASMRKIQGLFKALNSKSFSNSFQGLKVNEIYWSKCYNSTSEMLDWDNGDISTGKLV